MTAYSKTWLQFVFPFYLWLIMIVIIVAAHYSVKVSKLMGRQTVSVLATVLLLSFTKIFSTTLLALQLSYINCNDETLSLWTVDPNISYSSSEHIIMTIFALIMFWILTLPFTIILLFSPVIEKFLTSYMCCKWYIKLKPLFDAYNGPYNDRYRFWTGLLLLVRLVLVQVVTTLTKKQIRLP